MTDPLRIGVIADTHGLLRPEALEALHGCALIVHAGDIGGPAILARLAALAPTHAVRGNNDDGAWAAALPEQLDLHLGGRHLHVLHDLRSPPGPLPAADVIVCGHSHKPLLEQRGPTLVLNPGSAGPRRFRLPVTLAILTLGDGPPQARHLSLLAEPPDRTSTLPAERGSEGPPT